MPATNLLLVAGHAFIVWWRDGGKQDAHSYLSDGTYDLRVMNAAKNRAVTLAGAGARRQERQNCG